MSVSKKIVLVTGGNAGLGLEASLHIAKQVNTHLILTGRDATRVHTAAEKARAVAHATSVVEEGVLDLGSLRAVKNYCDSLLQRPDVPAIDAILCNAGVQIHGDKQTTADGLEMTFGVNHMGHFLLATLLRERTQRLVVISSETHDPEEKTPLPPPNVSDLEQLAFGYPVYNTGEVYATSKLCNLLFMTEWLARFPTGPECIAYSPGFTPDSDLYRNAKWDLSKILETCKANNVPVSTCAASGAVMGRLCVEEWAPNGWKSGQYIRVDHVYHTSAQAKDPQLATALWNKSEELVARLLNQN